jgi:hypothetical protein
MRVAIVIFLVAGLTMGALALAGVGDERTPRAAEADQNTVEEEVLVELCPTWERGDSRSYEINRTTKTPDLPAPLGFRRRADVSVTAAPLDISLIGHSARLGLMPSIPVISCGKLWRQLVTQP